jgi:integrase
MATLYERKNSPFWWIKYRDQSGVLVQKSTGYRVWNAIETQHAKVFLFEKRLEEAKLSEAKKDGWDGWVLPFLERRYRNKLTFARMRSVWHSMERYFELNGITSPRQLTYQDCVTYPDWRGKEVTRNHAINEIKTLSVIMGEAVKLGFIKTNPCTKLGLKKDKVRQKPEISTKEEEKIRRALKKEPEWMRVAFEIAIHQGCRLRETSVAFSDIDLEGETITFDAKGGNRFTTKLHPELVPLLKSLKARRKTRTCEIPQMASKFLRKVFDKIGLKHICFHCTRVTVITRLARAGVSMAQAMRFVGHASELIHRVYQRLTCDDLSLCVQALSRNLPRESRGSASSKTKRPRK